MSGLTGDYIRLNSVTGVLPVLPTGISAEVGVSEPGRDAGVTVEHNNGSFGDLLTSKLQDSSASEVSVIGNGGMPQVASKFQKLQFSAHSLKRIESRNINIAEVCEKLEQGTEIAEKKGASNSLILVDTAAFIVNIASHKVITALSDADLRGAAFTNIDTTVIM